MITLSVNIYCDFCGAGISKFSANAPAGIAPALYDYNVAIIDKRHACKECAAKAIKAIEQPTD